MNEEKQVIHKKDIKEAEVQVEELVDERDNIIKTLEARVEELEKKLEFSEDVISDLNDMFTDQETTIKVLARQLAL